MSTTPLLPSRREVLEVAKATMQKYFEQGHLDSDAFKSIAKDLTVMYPKGQVAQDVVEIAVRQKMLDVITDVDIRNEIQAAGTSLNAVPLHDGANSSAPVLGSAPPAAAPSSAAPAAGANAGVTGLLSGFRRHIQKAKEVSLMAAAAAMAPPVTEKEVPKSVVNPPDTTAINQVVKETSSENVTRAPVDARLPGNPAKELVSVQEDGRKAASPLPSAFESTLSAATQPANGTTNDDDMQRPAKKPRIESQTPLIFAPKSKADEEELDLYGDVPVPPSATPASSAASSSTGLAGTAPFVVGEASQGPVFSSTLGLPLLPSQQALIASRGGGGVLPTLPAFTSDDPTQGFVMPAAGSAYRPTAGLPPPGLYVGGVMPGAMGMMPQQHLAPYGYPQVAMPPLPHHPYADYASPPPASSARGGPMMGGGDAPGWVMPGPQGPRPMGGGPSVLL